MNELNYSQSVVRQFHCLVIAISTVWLNVHVGRLVNLTTSPQFVLLSLPVSNNVSEGKVVQFLTNIVTAVCFSAHVRSVAHIGKWWCYDSIRFAGRHFDTSGFSQNAAKEFSGFQHHEGFSQNAAKELSGFQHHEGFSQNAAKGFSGFHYHEGFSQSWKWKHFYSIFRIFKPFQDSPAFCGIFNFHKKAGGLWELRHDCLAVLKRFTLVNPIFFWARLRRATYWLNSLL